MTPTPPPRRFTDLDVIRRAAARLRDDPDPLRREVATWLGYIATDYDDPGPPEIRSAAAVARAALTEAARLDPPCQPDCPTCHPAPGGAA